MLKKEMLQRSPIRVLEKSINGKLGTGNLGVFTARKGVGKTACLIHVATDKLLRDKKVLHISFTGDPHHIEWWYKQVYQEVATAYKLKNAIENYDQMIHNRLILNFNQKDMDLNHVKKSIVQFKESAGFDPELIMVDGFSFYNASENDFKTWKSIAEDLKVEMWFSATMHRENMKFDLLGIPTPVNKYYDYLSVIIMLNPKKSYVDLTLLKDHESTELEKLRLKLDPKTLMITNHRV